MKFKQRHFTAFSYPPFLNTHNETVLFLHC